MVAFTPHTYVTFGGTLGEVGTGDEVWQCGIRGFDPSPDAPIAEAQLQNYLDSIVDGVKAWYANAQSHHNVTAKLQWIKVANIAASGHYSGEPKIADGLNTAGGAGGTGVPSFCSVAISWGTGASFGKAQRGRIYPPNYGVPVNPNEATITDTARSDIQTRAHDLLDAISTTGSEFAFKPHVVSSAGPHRLITTISVGNVIDVQRRRKDKVRESYVVGPWPAG